MLQAWPTPYLFARFTRIDAFATLVLGRLNNVGNVCRPAGATRYFPYHHIIFYPQIAIKNRLVQRLQNLTHAFPQRPLCGSGIVHDLRRYIEAHSCPAAEVVLRPTAVSIGSEGNPGGAHGISELLWRVGSPKGSATNVRLTQQAR